MIPDFAVRADVAVIVEIGAVDLVGWSVAALAALVAQLNHLRENDVGCGVRRVEQPVERGVEQIIADHDEAGMLVRLGMMIGHHVACRQSAGNAIHRGQPAMRLAFHEMRTCIAK